MKFAVHVEVRGLDTIADPEGETIERALVTLGITCVEHVRVGKVIRLELDAHDADEATRTAEDLCHRLLANPVIEHAEVVVEPLTTSPAPSSS